MHISEMTKSFMPIYELICTIKLQVYHDIWVLLSKFQIYLNMNYFLSLLFWSIFHNISSQLFYFLWRCCSNHIHPREWICSFNNQNFHSPGMKYNDVLSLSNYYILEFLWRYFSFMSKPRRIYNVTKYFVLVTHIFIFINSITCLFSDILCTACYYIHFREWSIFNGIYFMTFQ